MAECVSCGKEIAAGKFFCEDCYTKMKGRRRPTGKVPGIPAGDREEASVREDTAAEAGPERYPAVPEGVIPERKATGTLTPASHKQVVSMRPPTEKTTREKAGKKKFTVTITFSERTYAALSRLNVRKSREARTSQDDQADSQTARLRSRAAERRRSIRGKPRLQAVGATEETPKRRSGFMGMIAYRDRAADSRDIAAMAMAVAAVLAILLLSFQPWARISLENPEVPEMLVVEVSGTDLGAITYVCIAISVAALLYAAASWTFKGVFATVDFGVVLIVVGVAFIPLFYAAISSNARVLTAALEQLGIGGSPLPEQFERQTLWPAYVMVLAGILLAFAGLVRLSERRNGKSTKK